MEARLAIGGQLTDEQGPIGYDPCHVQLYSSTCSQDKIRRTFAVDCDEAGNLPPPPGILPDQMAPVAYTADGERVLTMMRWGLVKVGRR